MATTTSIQALPLPTYDDAPNIPDHLLALAQAIEQKLVMVFATTTDRDAKNPIPSGGMICFITNTLEFQAYDQTGWRTFLSFTAGTNSTRYGGLVSYVTGSRPTPSAPGFLGYNRTTGALEVYTPSNAWALAAAQSFQTISHVIYGAGINVSPGNSYTAAAVSFTTVAANTRVELHGECAVTITGTGSFHTATYMDLLVNKPGGGQDVIPGAGALLEGNNIRQDTPTFTVPYLAATAGTYSLQLRISAAGTAGTSTAVSQTHTRVKPYVQSNAF
jgi:hypothetical protein